MNQGKILHSAKKRANLEIPKNFSANSCFFEKLHSKNQNVIFQYKNLKKWNKKWKTLSFFGNIIIMIGRNLNREKRKILNFRNEIFEIFFGSFLMIAQKSY